MTSGERYYYRKMNGICVSCGEMAQKGKTRCIRCAQIDAAKQKMREESYPQERREALKTYRRDYMRKHPDKNREYQRRYRET